MQPEQMVFNVGFVLLGFIAHVLKKAAVEKIGIIEYITVKKSRTFASISTTIVAFASLLSMRPDATPMEFFAVGYMGDSVVNKTPSEVERIEHQMKKAGPTE